MGYVVDKAILETDPHMEYGCEFCHQGNVDGSSKQQAHSGLVKRPSDDPDTCGVCHEETAKSYKLSLHYTTAGFRNGVSPRFSEKEKATYDEKVFEQSCRSCHASCGDCHVKSPVISGVNLGLMDGHKFVRKDEAKTCALCHGGRVYPEFTGDYGGTPDVHYQAGMSCMDCHDVSQMHGSGVMEMDRKSISNKPSCVQCHSSTSEQSDEAKEAHETHGDAVSCQACHTATGYRQCSSCHVGEGAAAEPAILLGRNPRNPDQFTTLRLIPTVRDTFAKKGIAQENYDELPNYWDAAVHNIKKRTDRTRDCAACHSDRKHFLEEEAIPEGLSKKNLELVHRGH